MPHSLSDRQREYLAFIRSFVAENESSPRLDEIAKHFSVKPPTVHKMLERLQAKGYILFGRDSLSGFWIRLLEKAGSSEAVTEIQILGRLNQYGEAYEFPKHLGHFATDLSGSKPTEVFALVASEDIPLAKIAIGDALVFDRGRNAKPQDICIAAIGNRLLLVKIVNKTFDNRFLSDVMASDYPMPEDVPSRERKQLLNWFPLAYEEGNMEYFRHMMKEQNLAPKEIPNELILATAIRLSRQLSW